MEVYGVAACFLTGKLYDCFALHFCLVLPVIAQYMRVSNSEKTVRHQYVLIILTGKSQYVSRLFGDREKKSLVTAKLLSALVCRTTMNKE